MSDNMEKGRRLYPKVRRQPETDSIKTIATSSGSLADAHKIIREESEVSKQLEKGKGLFSQVPNQS